jgi:hypothetical protein
MRYASYVVRAACWGTGGQRRCLSGRGDSYLHETRRIMIRIIAMLRNSHAFPAEELSPLVALLSLDVEG